MRKTLAIAAGIFFAAGCGHKNKTVARVPATPAPRAAPSGSRQSTKQTAAMPVGYIEEGVASWYGIPYHGRRAADGEVYDMETLVAAHRVMPFNTWLKVTNLSNNKTVSVRIIDLSKAAARRIEMLGPGISRVRLEVIAAPADIPADDFYAVQVGAFSVYENAERVRAAYEQRFGVAQLFPILGTAPRWRVLVGKETTVAGAQQLADTLMAEKHEAFVVRLDEKLPVPAPKPPPVVVEQLPGMVTSDPRQSVPITQQTPSTEQQPPQ